MDWLTFVSKIIGDTAWPVAALSIVLLLRKEIQSAIGFVSKLKVSGVEIEFDRKLADAKAEASELPDALLNAGDRKRLITESAIVLAKSSPRSSVLESWRLVEIAALECAKRIYKNEEFKNSTMTFRAIQLLERKEALPPAAFGLIKKLRSLRNDAAHAPNFELSPESAIEYAHLAAQLIATLNDTAAQPGH